MQHLYHPVRYKANFHTISTGMIDCSQVHVCSDVNTKNGGSAQREGYSIELSGKAITIALFASLGHAHYFIRVASTTIKDWRLDDA